MAAVDKAIQLQANGRYNRVATAGTLEVGAAIDASAAGVLGIGGATATSVSIVTAGTQIALFDGSGVLSIRETAAPAATANFGKLYVKSADSNLYFKDDAGTEYQITPPGGGGGVTTLAAIGAAPNANGATIAGVTLNLEPASATFGGVVTTGIQSFAGAKTFTGTLSAAGITSSTGALTLTGAATGALLSTAGVVAPLAPSTSGNVLTSNGTTWISAAPVGTIGGTIALNQVAYGAGANTIQGSANATFDGTTFTVSPGGSAAFTVNASTLDRVSIVGGALASTKNALMVSGTISSTNAKQNGVDFQITGAGASANIVAGLNIDFLAGYTGSNTSAGIATDNSSAGTGTSFVNVLQGNQGVRGSAIATTTGTNLGVAGQAYGGDISVGVHGLSVVDKVGADNVGVSGFGLNATGTQVGGYFGLQNATPTFTSAALMADNGSTTDPIFVARDNGSAVLTVADGGGITATSLATTGVVISTTGLLSSVAPGSSGNVLTSNGTTWTSAAPAAGGVTTLAAIGAAPNANGATISGVTLNLEPASATFGGVVTTGTQSFAGAKTFTGTLSAAGITSSTGALTLTGAATGVLLSTAGTVAPLAPGTSGNVLTSNGTTWVSSAATGTIGGSIALNQIAYGSGANTIQGSANGTFDGITLTINNGASTNAIIVGQDNGSTVLNLIDGGLLGVGSSFTPTSTIHAKTGANAQVAAESTSSSNRSGFIATNNSGNNFILFLGGSAEAGTGLGQNFANAARFFTSGPSRILFGSDSFGGGAPIYFGVNDVETMRLGLSTDHRVTITGATLATTKQALNITATLPNPGGATTEKAIQKTITLATSANNSNQFGQRLDMVATGYTGSGTVIGQYTYNDSAGTSTGIWSGLGGNWGTGAAALGTTATGHNVGQHGYAGNGLLNIGSYGMSDVIGNGKTNIGVAGRGINGGTGGAVHIGGYFTLKDTTLPTFTSAALIADNGTQTDPIFLARDNGSTVFTIADGGGITATSLATTGVVISTTGLLSSVAPGSSGNVLTSNGTTWTSAAPSLGNAFVQNGNSFTANAVLGTNDAFTLSFETTGTTKMTIGQQTDDIATISGGTLSTTKNALKVTGTTSTTNAGQTGVFFDITPGTSSGASASQYAFYGLLEAGYTGVAETVGVRAGNVTNGVGVTPIGSGNFGGNFGASGIVANSTVGHNVGTLGYAQGSSVANYGVAGSGRASSATAANYGVAGSGVNDGGGHRVGGYFYINSAAAQEPTTARSVGLVASNGNLAENIFEARDGVSNSVFTIADGGILTSSPGSVTVLTVDSTSNDRVLIAGATLASTKNALKVTGTLSTTSASQVGARFDITTSATSGTPLSVGVYSALAAGYTQAGTTASIFADNDVAGTGATPITNERGNYAGAFKAQAATAGYNIGAIGRARDSTVANYGLLGLTPTTTAGANVGVVGVAANATGTAAGGYFSLGAAELSFLSAALIANNGTTSSPIFLARDNSSTVFTIADGATAVTFGTGFDRDASGTYAIGGTNITTLSVGRTGQTTSFLGNTSIAQAQTVGRTTVADANYNVVDADYIVAYTSISAARVVNLQTAAGKTGRVVIIKDESGSCSAGNSITITPNGAETIDGAAGLLFAKPYAVMTLYSNGANWFTLDDT